MLANKETHLEKIRMLFSKLGANETGAITYQMFYDGVQTPAVQESSPNTVRCLLGRVVDVSDMLFRDCGPSFLEISMPISVLHRQCLAQN